MFYSEKLILHIEAAFEPHCDKTNNVANVDIANEHGHLPTLIRSFAVLSFDIYGSEKTAKTLIRLG